MKKFFWLCAALAVTFAAGAGTVFFRSGMVLCAEVSNIKPYGFKRLCASEAPKRARFVAVTVKLDRGRKIGIFDYSLRIKGKSYDCAAIRDSDGDELTDVTDGGRKRRCTLFFEVAAPALPEGGKAQLVCNAPGGGETAIKLVDRGDRRFTPDSKIPEPGSEKSGK